MGGCSGWLPSSVGQDDTRWRKVKKDYELANCPRLKRNDHWGKTNLLVLKNYEVKQKGGGRCRWRMQGQGVLVENAGPCLFQRATPRARRILFSSVLCSMYVCACMYI